MKKIYQYILLAVALVATASCSQELDDTLKPVENGSLQFVVSDFPAFGEGTQTRASSLGTPDAGKTAWETNDKITVIFTSEYYGEQTATLIYGEDGTWASSGILSYLKTETPTITAVYTSSDTPGLGEYLVTTDCTLAGNALSITFEGAERTYSRLRIATLADMPLTVSTTGFTPAGATEVVTSAYTLTADKKGNAYLYGTFAAGASVTVTSGDMTMAIYAFEEEDYPNGTEPGKSYALYAGPKFSVSADKKVLFAPGNLQYTQSTDTWSFADEQWEVIGGANFTNPEDLGYGCWTGDGLADVIDLFGWSSDNPKTPFGVSTSGEDTDYVGNFVDWGTNQIGDYTPNTWRTLSADEWLYLLHGRDKAESLFALSTVNDVPGLVILPDNWETPSGLTFVASTAPDDDFEWITNFEYYIDHTDYLFFEHNTYTAAQWEQMEAAGAVFLPVTGDRYESELFSFDSAAYYWSATPYNETSSHTLRFDKKVIAPKDNYYCSDGLAVRLVREL